MVARNPDVRDAMIMVDNPRRSDGVLKNARRMVAWQNVTAKVAIHETTGVNEPKMIRAKAEREIISHRTSVKCEADTCNKSRTQRQWSPATIITALPPANP